MNLSKIISRLFFIKIRQNDKQSSKVMCGEYFRFVGHLKKSNGRVQQFSEKLKSKAVGIGLEKQEEDQPMERPILPEIHFLETTNEDLFELQIKETISEYNPLENNEQDKLEKTDKLILNLELEASEEKQQNKCEQHFPNYVSTQTEQQICNDDHLNDHDEEGDFQPLSNPLEETQQSLNELYSCKETDSPESSFPSSSKCSKSPSALHDEKDNFKYTCSLCQRKFKYEQHYRIHSRLKHKIIPHNIELKCSHCELKLPSKTEFNKHSRHCLPLEERQVFPCPHCERKFATKKSAEEHAMLQHVNTQLRAFVCEQCGLAVRTIGILKEHLLTHREDAAFGCEICQKQFKTKYKLKLHMEIHDSKKFPCPTCSVELPSRLHLQRHVRVHDERNKYKCEVCGKGFKTTMDLKCHMILHIGLKPYACDFCDKTFASYSNCRSHKKRKHAEEFAVPEAQGVVALPKKIPHMKTIRALIKTTNNIKPIRTKKYRSAVAAKGSEAAGAAADLSALNELELFNFNLSPLENYAHELYSCNSPMSILNELV